MPYTHQIRINTRILDSNGKALHVKIITNGWTYTLKYHGVEIGYAAFKVEENSIYITRMYNHTVKNQEKIQHVGSVLFECIFKTSLELGKGGNIWLNSIQESSIPYYKMGLRKQNDSYSFFYNKITKYKEDKNSSNKNELINEFEKYPYGYDELKKEAAYSLKKHISEITFDEIINYGRYSKDNDDFAKLLKNKNNLTYIDYYKMQTYMYLPQDIIDSLIKKFDIYTFSPIGSNYAGSFLLEQSGYSFNQFPDKLKDALKDKAIDPANAIEIFAKHPTKDQIDVILSPIGLELMNRNYVSGYYMMVYLQNKLKQVTSEKFLYSLEDGTITHIEDYIEHPDKFEKLFDTEYATTLGDIPD